MKEINFKLNTIWIFTHFQKNIYFVVENTDDDERQDKLAADTEDSVTENENNDYKTFY